MGPLHTSLYVGGFAVLYIVLSYRVSLARRRNRTSLGSGEPDSELNRAVRVQGNFGEYVPLALVLIGFLEMVGAPVIGVHLLAGSLLVGRLLHAYGLTKVAGRSAPRYWGTASAYLVIVIAGLWTSVLAAFKLLS